MKVSTYYNNHRLSNGTVSLQFLSVLEVGDMPSLLVSQNLGSPF